jgi:hypothetical protein
MLVEWTWTYQDRGEHTPSVDDGGELEAQALAKRRGGLDKDIVALQCRTYNVTLEGPG